MLHSLFRLLHLLLVLSLAHLQSLLELRLTPPFIPHHIRQVLVRGRQLAPSVERRRSVHVQALLEVRHAQTVVRLRPLRVQLHRLLRVLLRLLEHLQFHERSAAVPVQSAPQHRSQHLPLVIRVDGDRRREVLDRLLVVLRGERRTALLALLVAQLPLSVSELRHGLLCLRFLRLELLLDGGHHRLHVLALELLRQVDQQLHDLLALSLHGEVDRLQLVLGGGAVRQCLGLRERQERLHRLDVLSLHGNVERSDVVVQGDLSVRTDGLILRRDPRGTRAAA